MNLKAPTMGYSVCTECELPNVLPGHQSPCHACREEIGQRAFVKRYGNTPDETPSRVYGGGMVEVTIEELERLVSGVPPQLWE
jgi:hypothetical protein